MYIVYIMLMTNDLIKAMEQNMLDLTPFSEPVDFELEHFGAGFKAKVKLHINYRWDTECEWLESNRVFGHKGQITSTEFNKECVTAIADLQEKLLFVFKANHGLLDRKGAGMSGTIRFKA